MSGSGMDTTTTLRQENAPRYQSMDGRLYRPLLDGLAHMGYEYMSPVQHKVLTELPSFKADCLVQAKTGTGKTIAFLLPALHNILTEKPVPAGKVGILIISPTRELALQIANECNRLTAKLPKPMECHTAFGGTSKDRHLKEFLNGKPTVLVATPGRLNDYLSDGYVREAFNSVRTVILDEADTMLEAGFLKAIQEILRSLPPKATGWQGMCFSATIPEKIKEVLGNVLKRDYTHLTTVDPNEVPTIDQVAQYSVIIPTVSDTFNVLYSLIEQERQQASGEFKAIIFGTTANGVAFMHELFANLYQNTGVNVYQLQSRLSQSQRTRTTEEFKRTSSGLMFASDVIGRGMDFPNVGLVIQVGLPSNGEQYVHRVGRTARAGTSGRAVILLTDREKYFVTINKHLPIQQYNMDLHSAAGIAASRVDQALGSVDEKTVAKAYQAYLGFHKTFMKQLRLDPAGLVALSNELATAMGAAETPMIDKMVVGKMGLKGVQGLNVGVVERQGRGSQGGGRGGRGGGAAKATHYAGAANARPSSENSNPRGGVQKRGRGSGPGRKGGWRKAHQGPPGGES